MSALTGVSLAVFLSLTVVVIGGGGVLTGLAIGRNWRPAKQAAAAALGLGLFDRFLIYALFDGPLLSVTGYLIDSAVVLVMALAAWRIANVARMVQQYPWLYRRAGLFSYRPK